MKESEMNERLGRPFWFAVLCAMSSGGLALATEVPNWFEVATRRTPDGGDGSMERLLAIGLGATAVTMFAFAALRWWRVMQTNRFTKRLRS